MLPEAMLLLVGTIDRHIVLVIRHQDAGNAPRIDGRLAGANSGVSRRQNEQGHLGGAEREAWIVFEPRTHSQLPRPRSHPPHPPPPPHPSRGLPPPPPPSLT